MKKINSSKHYTKQMISLIIFLLFLFLYFDPKAAFAATLNVPQDFPSISAAYDVANNGDEILVAPGTYTTCLSGNRSKMISIKAQYPATSSPNNQHSILNSTCSHVIQFKTPLDNDGQFQPGDHVEFIGFVLNGSDDGFSYEAASGIVKDNIISGQSDDPIDVDGPSEAHIIGNILKEGVGGGDGIENRLHGFSSNRIIKMIFMNNIIYKSKNNAIQLIDQTGIQTKRKYLIANNLIISNGQAGIGTTQGGSSSQTISGYALPEEIYILHNTFVNNAWGGIIGGANMKVHNNIFYNNSLVALKNVSGNSIASHNLFFGNASDFEGSNIQDPNLTADPKFLNTNLPPNFSSFILDPGSPAIDAGMNVNNYYFEFGLNPPAQSGSAPDLGWKEYLSTATTTPTSTIPSPTPTSSVNPTLTPSPTPTPTCPQGNIVADANDDCKVDGRDYVIWLNNYNRNVTTGAASGDFDNSGKVDGLDYVLWLNSYGSDSQPSSCLSREGPLLTVSGQQTSRFDKRSQPLAVNTKVDARSASWEGIHDYPVIFSGGPDICWSGGTIRGLYPPDTSWDIMHGTGAFNIYAPKTTVERIRIDDYGDGLRVLDFAKDFTVRGVYLSYIRDDCVENDYLHSGLVEDSLFDGCYQGFSARTWSGQTDVVNGSNNLWTIRNSLIRLQPMEKVYQDRGLIPGHDGFFKWDQSGISPQLSLHNNIFRADQASNNVGLGLPPGKLISCSNNIMIWLGAGPFPEQLPETSNSQPCFNITTDKSVWDKAVSDWLTQHSP